MPVRSTRVSAASERLREANAAKRESFHFWDHWACQAESQTSMRVQNGRAALRVRTPEVAGGNAGEAGISGICPRQAQSTFHQIRSSEIRPARKGDLAAIRSLIQMFPQQLVQRNLRAYRHFSLPASAASSSDVVPFRFTPREWLKYAAWPFIPISRAAAGRRSSSGVASSGPLSAGSGIFRVDQPDFILRAARLRNVPP